MYQGKIEKHDTRIGELEFENGFENGVPTLESSEKLIESFYVMNATVAYSWAGKTDAPDHPYPELIDNLESLLSTYY